MAGRASSSPGSPRVFRSRILCFALLIGAAALASPAAATIVGIPIDPAQPTSCDAVTIGISGELPNTCYEIVNATIEGPEQPPCMRMTPCPFYFRIAIAAREPNPALEIVCGLNAPYTRSFPVGKLPPGEYIVAAVERIFPFSADSDTVVTQTTAETRFTVLPDSTCAPGTGSCYLMGFAPDPLPGPGIPCTAVAAPGGTACLDLTLTNFQPVAGVQTTIIVENSAGAADAFLHAISVEPTRRAAGFEVGWNAEGARTKILLYSTAGAAIATGEGPVLRICYAVAPETPAQVFRVQSTEEIVADSTGSSIPPCPTFAPIAPATICVGSLGCDVNGDGISDVLDVIRMVHCALEGAGSASCPDTIAARSDCNGDGTIDIRDVICCVRRILSMPPPLLRMGATDMGSSSGSGTSIGFAGPVSWSNEVEGVAVVELRPDTDWGGSQFTIDTRGAPARVRGMRLLDALNTDQMEWAAGGSGIANAMIFSSAPGSRAPAPIRVEVSLERIPGVAAGGTLRLAEARSGTRLGSAAPTSVFNGEVSVAEGAIAAPMLLGARPNPAFGATEVAFALPSDARAALRLYDVAGRLVRVLVSGPMTAGLHRVRWDGTDSAGQAAPAGIYFAKLEVARTVRSGRLLLLR